MGFWNAPGVSSPGSGGGSGAAATFVIDKTYLVDGANGDDTRADVAADRYDQLKPWATLNAVLLDITASAATGKFVIRMAPGTYAAGGTVNLPASQSSISIQALGGGSVSINGEIDIQGGAFSLFEMIGVDMFVSGNAGCIDATSTVTSIIRFRDCNFIASTSFTDTVRINADFFEFYNCSIQMFDGGSGSIARAPIRVQNAGPCVVTGFSSRIVYQSSNTSKDVYLWRLDNVIQADQLVLNLQSCSMEISRLSASPTTGDSAFFDIETSFRCEAEIQACKCELTVNGAGSTGGMELVFADGTGVVNFKMTSTQIAWTGIPDAQVFTAAVDNANANIILLDCAWTDMVADAFPARRTLGADAGDVVMEGVNNFGSRTP